MRKRNRITDEEREAIRTLTLEGVGQREISRRLNVHYGTVRRHQLRFNLPTRLATPEEQIRTLIGSGKTRKEVARELAIHRNTVCQHLKKSSLAMPYCGRRRPGLPEAQETEALALLKSGHGTSWIGKHLGVPEYQVRLIAEKVNFRRKRGERGYRYYVSASKRQKITEEILGRRNFCRTLAFKYNVSDKFVRKLAHQLLGCSHFIGGYGEPLSSNFPQKHYAKQHTA